MKDNYYKDEYMPQVNKIGKLTGYLGVLVSFTPAVVMAVVYGIFPKPAALLTAFISGASAFGVLWFVEPISYFPVVGTAGTYMAFLSGNISNSTGYGFTFVINGVNQHDIRNISSLYYDVLYFIDLEQAGITEPGEYDIVLKNMYGTNSKSTTANIDIYEI